MTALAYLQQLPAAASLLQLSRPIRVVVRVRLSHRHQADSDKADSLFLVLGSVRSLRQAMADVSPDARATPAPQSFLPFDTVPHPPPPPSQGTSDANAARKRRQAPAVGARPSASRAGTLYPICRLGSVSSGGEDASCRRLLWRCGAASHFRSRTASARAMLSLACLWPKGRARERQRLRGCAAAGRGCCLPALPKSATVVSQWLQVDGSGRVPCWWGMSVRGKSYFAWLKFGISNRLKKELKLHTVYAVISEAIKPLQLVGHWQAAEIKFESKFDPLRPCRSSGNLSEGCSRR